MCPINHVYLASGRSFAESARITICMVVLMCGDARMGMHCVQSNLYATSNQSSSAVLAYFKGLLLGIAM